MGNNLSAFVACSMSPSLFMSRAFKMEPDEWQTSLLDTFPPKSLLLCSRQSGKSTVSATLALHQAAYSSNSLVLIVSKAYRQAEELFRKVKVGVPFIKSHVEIVRENQSSLELDNGSRIISLPGKEETIRSYSSVALLIIDEAAQVSEELYATVRPMLAISRGKLLALTTPFGKQGWFYKSWENDKGWYKVKITAHECPRITEEFLQGERDHIGDLWVRQEFMCEFVDNDVQLFSYDEIIKCITSEVEAW